jgi:hypothetical protein
MTEEQDKDKEITGKPVNVAPGGDVTADSFFESFGDIEDGLGNLNFSKLGEDSHESINDIIGSDNIKLSPQDSPPQPKPKNLKSKTLPTVPINKNPERSKMTTKKETGIFDTNDPNAQSLNEIFQEMSTPNYASDYKLMVMRLEPQSIKGLKISGYLETFHLPTSIPDIIEQVGQRYGGGKYNLRIVDGNGKYVKSKTFEIAGLPKIPKPEDDTPRPSAVVADVQQTPSTEIGGAAVTANTPTPISTSASSIEDDDEYDDDEFDPTPRRRLRPLGGGGGYSESYSPYASMQSPYSQPYSSPYSEYQRPSYRDRDKSDEVSKSDLESLKRDVEDRIVDKIESKFENKFDRMADLMQNMQNLVVANQNKKPDSFFNADVVKALAPVFVSWMDTKSSKDSANAGQFADTNKQVVGLMQGMQDLVRIGDKTKEEFLEKERREREQSRREEMEARQKTEERFLEQQRRNEERHQQILLQMKETLENSHRSSTDGEGKLRLEYEKMREEFRIREEQARREHMEREEQRRREDRDREERIREEARKKEDEARRWELEQREQARQREEEARRREQEHRDKMLQEERKWRDEIRQREEHARQKEIEFREELRQKEVAALNDGKLKELEIMERIRNMDSQKTEIQQKLLEQIYNNNLGNRESQLHMEMAIAKMTSENEAKMLQANAQMELEKIRHVTQMQMSQMKGELSLAEDKKKDDSFDDAIKEYLQRKLQIDMINDLNFDSTDDEQSSSLVGLLEKLAKGAGPLLDMLTGRGMGGGGMKQPGLPSGRVVSPTPNPPRPRPKVVKPPVDEDEDEEEEKHDEEPHEDVEDQQEQSVHNEDEFHDEGDESEEFDEDETDDFYGIDPMQEIPRVAEFFEYLKTSIEAGDVTPEEAASVAKDTLSEPIVAFLMDVEDSTIVIGQLYPLLSSMYDDEFVAFFVQPETVEWMDRLLIALADDEPEAEAEVEAEPEAKPEVEAKPEEVKTEAEAKPKPKPKARKKAKKEPEVKEPEVKEPEVKEPEVKEPEVKEPEVKEPEVKEPT